jgi:4a-hydroxytetrahydrobiopterin dehydratase
VPTPLSPEESAARLAEVPGWEIADGVLRREYSFERYLDGVAFAGRVAELAEVADHHPDILIGYRRVTLTLVSHDAGGLTERDFRLAAKVDEKADSR